MKENMSKIMERATMRSIQVSNPILIVRDIFEDILLNTPEHLNKMTENAPFLNLCYAFMGTQCQAPLVRLLEALKATDDPLEVLRSIKIKTEISLYP